MRAKTEQTSNGPGKLTLVLLLCVAILAAATISVVRWMRSSLTDEQVVSSVMSTIQHEAAASFLVTGRLEMGTSATGTSTSILLPGILDLESGQTDVRVRVPGIATYGFDVQELSAEDIRYYEDGVVEIVLPELSVFTIEPLMEEAEIQTAVGGWQRFSRESERRMTQRVLSEIRPAFRRQAKSHLATAEQPRLNASRALSAMLTSPLEAAGLRNPRFRFILGEGDTLELGDEERRVIPIRPEGDQ